MPTINLKNFYPWVKQNEFVEVTDEMLETMKAADRQQNAYNLRTYRHKAYYSLDLGDGIDGAALYKAPSPEKLYEEKWVSEQLLKSMGKLTDKQTQRMYKFYFWGMKKVDIARDEGVTDGCITASIQAGLKRMEKDLAKIHKDLKSGNNNG